MRFYISSCLENKDRVAELASVLTGRGHELTYDWTGHGDIRSQGERVMSEVAFSELRAVRDAELMIALLPGGRGSHTELGLAIATRSNKRIIIWSEDGREFTDPESICAFYFHPSTERIVCPFETLKVLFDREQISSDILNTVKLEGSY